MKIALVSINGILTKLSPDDEQKYGCTFNYFLDLLMLKYPLKSINLNMYRLLF